MSLIRNGGFETGNIDFWSLLGEADFDVSTADPHSGTHHLRATATAAGAARVYGADYIEVSAGKRVYLQGYMKGSRVLSGQLSVQEYDSTLNYLRHTTLLTMDVETAYTLFSGIHFVGDDCAYIRPYIRSTVIAIGDTVDFDDISMLMEDRVNILSGEALLCDLNDIGVSGDTSADRHSVVDFYNFIADIEVADVQGTTPTLDLSIIERDLRGKDLIVGSFTQFTAEGSERIALTNCRGSMMYVTYTIGGTTPRFDIEVAIKGMR